MSEKISGYTLLILGILVIGYSALSIYKVFTRQSQPVQFFSGEGIKLDLSALLPSSSPTSPKPAPTEFVSANYLNDLSNLTAHYLLMSFLASIGFKIASLGTQLLRPIEVKLRAKNPQPTSSLTPDF